MNLTILMEKLSLKNLVRNASVLNWFEDRIGLDGSIGLLLLVATMLLIIGKNRRGIFLGNPILVFALTIVNLLIFYFDQFSNIVDSLIQFIVLIGFLRYKSRFIKNY